MTEENNTVKAPEYLELDLGFYSEPVKLKFKDASGGDVLLSLELREFDGDERDKYTNAIMQRTKIEDGKATGIKNFVGFQAELLSRCLFDPATNQPVEPVVIQAWPSRVRNAIHERAQKINGTGEGAVVVAKNV